MAFFNDLTRKLSMVGQEAASQTKVFAEKTRINAKISDEERQIDNYFQIIGKNYYEANKNNPNAEYQDQIVNIKDAYSRIDGLRDQLRMVTGIRNCPQCGAEVANGSLFCNACGMKMPVDTQPVVSPDGDVCPQCGNVVAIGAAFCNICGTKMPEIKRQPLGASITPQNGSFSTPGFDIPMNTAPAAPVVPAAPAAPIIPDVPVAPTAQPMPAADSFEAAPPKKTVSIEKKDEM